MESVVREIVADACPDATVVGIEPTRTGNFKQTAVVDLADRPSVVVQYRDLEHVHLRAEARVTQVIGRETEIPVAEVLAVGDIDGVSYVVTRRVPGVDLHRRFESLSVRRRERLAGTLGRFLGALHAGFAFEDYGAVVASNGALETTGEAERWRPWVLEYLDRGLAAFEAPLADLREPIRATVADGLDTLPDHPTPRLYPWDYRPGNVLLDADDDGSDRIAAVLDWGDPLAGHRELSLAKAEFLVADWYADPDGAVPERLRDAFYAGYERRMPVADGYWGGRRRLYRLVGVARSAFDSAGDVTLPRYPTVDEAAAAAFHRGHIEALLS